MRKVEPFSETYTCFRKNMYVFLKKRVHVFYVSFEQAFRPARERKGGEGNRLFDLFKSLSQHIGDITGNHALFGTIYGGQVACRPM